MPIISFCTSAGGNTGGIACDTKRDNPLIMLVGSATFDADDIASQEAFRTAILDRIKRAEGDSQKLYPFPLIEGSATTTEANKEVTLGNGRKVIISEGRPGYTFDIESAGINQQKSIRKFNKSTLPVFVFDESGNVWGRLNSANIFVGTDAQIFTKGSGFGDFSGASLTQVSVNFISAGDFFDNAAYVNTDFSVTDFEGLLDAVLYETAAHTSNAYKIGIKVINASLGNDVSIKDTYGSALAVANLWVAKTGANYATTLAITSVAQDNTNGGWTVTLDSTAYGALASQAKIKLSLVAPAVLDAADVRGIESVPLIITKP